jgi:hypothetical protein
MSSRVNIAVGLPVALVSVLLAGLPWWVLAPGLQWLTLPALGLLVGGTVSWLSNRPAGGAASPESGAAVSQENAELRTLLREVLPAYCSTSIWPVWAVQRFLKVPKVQLNCWSCVNGNYTP